MKKTNNLILFSIIVVIIISGFNIQKNIPTTISQADDMIKEDINDDVTPRAAQEQATYDWGGGRNMVIDADPDNNKTLTTINNGGDSLPIYSELNETQATTILDNSGYYTMKDMTTTLYNENTGNTAEIDHTFTDNSMDITVPPQYFFHSEAVGDYNDQSLESCDVDLSDSVTGNRVNMEYKRDDPDGYDLFVNLTGPSTNIQSDFAYDDVNNELLWRENTTLLGLGFYVSTYQAVINNSGVWINNIQRIDWLDGQRDSWAEALTGYPNIVAINVTEVSVNTVIISFMIYAYWTTPGPLIIPMSPIYDLIFTKSNATKITMELVLTTGSALSIVWYDNVLSITSEIGENAIFYKFYLWYITNDILYIALLPEFEIEFHWYLITIYTRGIFIEIGYLSDFHVVFWVIQFIWIDWVTRIEIILDLDDVFLEYQIDIRYYFWRYIYLVPTYIMPNMLFIRLIESSYGSITFDFTIEITDLWGNPVDGCIIEGDWDDYEIQPGDVTAVGGGSGRYALSLPAKRIGTLDPGLWLNLTAINAPYTNGTLNTQITIFDQLFINIVNFECYNTTEDDWWFIFSVEITNSLGIPIDPNTFAGTWDGDIIQVSEIKDTGVGTYDINVTAKFVEQGNPGIELYLATTKPDFMDGELTTDIAIDPKIKDKAIVEQPSGSGSGVPPTGDDDGGNKETEEIDIVFPILIGVGAVSAIGIAGITIFLLKRKR